MCLLRQTYATAEAEKHAARCYAQSVREIAALRLAHNTSRATFGENIYSDMCSEDFLATRTMQDLPDGTCYKSPIPYYDSPVNKTMAINWRDKGAVTPVKNQASCGSCWSFSATGAMEGAYFLANGTLLSFSEQMLVSCDTGGQDNGCSGGGPDTAFDWVIRNGGIALESDYPYTAKDDACDKSAASHKAATFGHFTYIERHNETKVLAALQNEGPISILVDATSAWQHYTGGVLDQKSCGTTGSGIDHAVLAVGFDPSGPAFIVKNSWGPSWGESGYMRLAFDENACNVAACFSYFVKTGPAPPPGPPGPGPGPGPPPPPPPPAPSFCGSHFSKAECEEDKTCHWCSAPWNMCFDSAMKCPS